MITEVTEGIKVTVKTHYRSDYSDPLKANFLFSYRINIENQSNHTVQLLRRHWHIFDSNGEYRQVKGDGIVGVQPVLSPNDIHEYESACTLSTEIGSMNGTYLFQRKVDGVQFEVVVPEFQLTAPYRLN